MQAADQKSDLEFAPQFVAMLAAGVYETKEVLAQFGVSPEQYTKLQDNHVFREMLVRFTMEYQQKGINAQLKAAMSVELLIHGMHKIAIDGDVNPEVRKQVFDSLVKLANLSKDAAPQATNQVAALQIVINNVQTATKQAVEDHGRVITIQPMDRTTYGE